MLFDKMCMIAEHHHQTLVPVLREARLFHLPVKAHEVIPKEFTKAEAEFLAETFFLPFPITVIEDKASCVLLLDSVDQQQGWEESRSFIECMPVLPDDPSAFDDGIEQGVISKEAMAQYLPPELHDAYVLTFGRIGAPSVIDARSLTWRFEIDMAYVASKQRVVMDSRQIQKNPDAYDRFMQAVGKNVRASLGEVLLFNTPDRFVVERSPVKMREPSQKTMAARSHERPLYTLLKPSEIRKALRLEDAAPADGTKAPHERRRHLRTYKAARYKAMKGKTVTIPACWVGPSEATVAKHHWKVLLDI